MSVGSIRGFTVEGIPFDAAGDANFNRKPTNVEITGVPTSGKTMIKRTKIVPVLEGVTLVVTESDVAALQSFSERLDPVKVSYVTAKGDRLRCIGAIQLDGYESEEGRLAIIVIPETTWTLFPA